MVSAQESGQWLSLQQAAEELGISTEALRMRVRREKVESKKSEDGKLYVWVDIARSKSKQQTGQDADTALVGELRDRIGYLERQVEEEREARRRADTLLARLMERVPELEAADGRGDSYDGGEESYEEPPQRGEQPDEGYTPTEEHAEPQTGSQRPAQKSPWWKRIFGG